MTTVGATDWLAWHGAYDDPDSVLSRRLTIVRTLLEDVLDRAPPGPIRLLSVCAGDGRDVLGVLARHPRAGDVAALLVDLDETLICTARDRAAALGLDGVTCEVGDAGMATWYERSVPAHVLMLCGVFGNVTPDDVRRTIGAAATVVEPGGAAIWTRHRRPPDQTPSIRRWFGESGFEEVDFCEVAGSLSSVGCHRRVTVVEPPPLPPRLFSFVGDGSGAHV